MKRLLLLFLLLSGLSIQAQYEAAHWFFGTHTGLDFTGGAPVAEPGGQISTEEGCSSISNACGDLLLYTDGVTVWNANHQVMQNGTGLKGDDSSTQSGIVVPKPDDTNIYYIFTVDDAFSSPSSDGMQYSVVDMTLDGGLGGIVAGQKNIRLVNSASEKVTAVSSADGNSVWVITLAPRTNSTSAPYSTFGSNMNTFYAFKITSSGVQTTATVSQLSLNVFNGIGYMKCSPDGTKIAIANANDNSAYIMDFNNTTGEVSNPVQLVLNMGNDSPYGLEFSPDSSKLYLSDWHNKVTQFDLSDNNRATVISSQSNYRSALQLGLDSKIYQTYTIGYGSGSNQLSVIENPNEAGTACNYRYRFVSLPSSMEVHQGLPPFIQSYFVQIDAPDTSAEFNNIFEVSSKEEIVSVNWDFGDGTTATSLPDNPPDNSHSQTTHSYTTTGNYMVTAVIHLAIGCDVTVTKEVNISIVLNSSNTSLCDTDTDGIMQVDLHQFDPSIIDNQPTTGTFQIKFYLSETDALSNQNEITSLYTNTSGSDKLFYSVTNTTTNDIRYGTFYLVINPKPETFSVSDLTACDDDTDGITIFDLTTSLPEILNGRNTPPFEVNFYVSATDAEAGTNAITDTTNYTNTTPDNETLWYRIENTNTGCYAVDSINLIIYPSPEIVMDDTFALCAGQSMQIVAPAGFVSYAWSTGDNTQDITVTTPGTYTLTVTDNNSCTSSKDITIVASDAAVIDDIAVKDFSEVNNNLITIYASGLGDYEYSLDGTNYQDENIFDGLFPGTYTVYVSDKNGCGVTTQEVDVLGAPQFFTPNGDGFNDYWQIINITKKTDSKINIYNRYGKLVHTMGSSSEGWDGNLHGKPLPADDYWFTVTIIENDKSKLHKGHFALKR